MQNSVQIEKPLVFDLDNYKLTEEADPMIHQSTGHGHVPVLDQDDENFQVIGSIIYLPTVRTKIWDRQEIYASYFSQFAEHLDPRPWLVMVQI